MAKSMDARFDNLQGGLLVIPVQLQYLIITVPDDVADLQGMFSAIPFFVLMDTLSQKM